MGPKVHPCQKWHGINCPWDQLSYNQPNYSVNNGFKSNEQTNVIHCFSGTELLVWYGDEYARELGLVRDKNLLFRPKYVNNEGNLVSFKQLNWIHGIVNLTRNRYVLITYLLF